MIRIKLLDLAVRIIKVDGLGVFRHRQFLCHTPHFHRKALQRTREVAVISRKAAQGLHIIEIAVP